MSSVVVPSPAFALVRSTTNWAESCFMVDSVRVRSLGPALLPTTPDRSEPVRERPRPRIGPLSGLCARDSPAPAISAFKIAAWAGPSAGGRTLGKGQPGAGPAPYRGSKDREVRVVDVQLDVVGEREVEVLVHELVALVADELPGGVGDGAVAEVGVLVDLGVDGAGGGGGEAGVDDGGALG